MPEEENTPSQPVQQPINPQPAPEPQPSKPIIITRPGRDTLGSPNEREVKNSD
jgi:hypothetical protein